MIGSLRRLVQLRQARSPKGGRPCRREPPSTKIPSDSFDDLIKQFKKFHLSSLPAQYPRSTPEDHRVVFFQKQRFKEQLKLKIRMDWEHLDEQGEIKTSILESRKKFLRQHGLLRDEFYYQGRVVYANKHLYDIHQKDVLGRTNLNRMLSGLCPVDKTGEDIIIIHHFNQTMSGPWVILTNVFHEEKSDHLHSYVWLKDKVIRTEFKRQRQDYWRFQALEALASLKRSQAKPK